MDFKYLFQSFQKTFVFMEVFPKNNFYRNDACSLKLTVLFSVGGFKEDS